MVAIRSEENEDETMIHSVIVSAFRNTAEAALVRRLRDEDELKLSLVAENEGNVVGHIAFSPVTVEFNITARPCLGLAPLAVKPDFQKQGIGSQLVRKGLESCMAMGYHTVFVLGDPEFYSRFGFRRADKFGLFSEYDETGAHFLVTQLRGAGMDGMGGLVSYLPVFKEVGL